jgi:predicted phosphodiesterase
VVVLSDIHGNLFRVRVVCNSHKDDFVVQIGDFGFGFISNAEFKRNWGLPRNLYFFAGNHDNVEKMKLHKNYLGRYGERIIQDRKFFFVSGAESIDKHRRFEGDSYWSNEQLNFEESNECLNQWEESDADILLSHDCGSYIVNKYFRNNENSWTQKHIQEMIRIRKPKIHIFGHWHLSMDIVEKEVRYICLEKEGFIKI